MTRNYSFPNFQRASTFGPRRGSLRLFVLARHNAWRKYTNKKLFNNFKLYQVAFVSRQNYGNVQMQYLVREIIELSVEHQIFL